MKTNFKMLLTLLVSVFMIISTVTQPIVANDKVEVSTSLNGRGYVEPRSLGDAVADTPALTSAVYDEIDGVLYAYSMTNGGYFNAVNVKENKVVYSEYVAGVNQVWAHTVTSDNVVYMAALGPNNDGWLLRYDPTVGKIEDLGTPFPGYQFWSITNDGTDNIYIGTFKEGAAVAVKYNIASSKFENLGAIDEKAGLGYIRSIAYHDNNLYLGMGVSASVYKMDLSDNSVENITKNTYDLIDKPNDKNDLKYVYDLGVVKNHLVARFDHDGEGAILLYNLIEQKWEDKVLKKKHDGNPDDFGAFGWNQLIDNDGITYVTYERKLHEINTNTLEDRVIGGSALGHRGSALYDFGEGLEFVTLERLGSMRKVRIEDGRKSSIPNVMRGSALQLHNLGKDNNGDLYTTTYPGGPRGAKYSMQDESYVSYSQGQAEGIVAGEGNDLYFGMYPGAFIERMDTETLERERLFELKTTHEQDRPYIMKFEDGLLLTGTIPDYKKVGGTLSIYNPKTKDLEVHRDIVEGQSIVGLAKYGNLIFGSTTIRGGLDAPVTADKPVIFVWDMDAKTKVKEIELELPGLNKTPMISGLTFDDNGHLWGAVDGFLFTMDPETYEVINYKNIYPNVVDRGMWRPVHIEFGDDGFVYSDVGGRLTVVDPSTDAWEHTTVATSKEVDFMTLSYDKHGNQNIYIVQAAPTGIDVVEIVDVDPTDEDETELIAKVLKPGVNFGFEDELNLEEPIIPGWSSLFDDVTENVSFEVTDEMAVTGKNSLKLTDGNDQETVFVISDPIKVEAETTYTVETMLYLKDGMNTLMIRYFDDNGKQVGADIDGVNIIHIRSGFNEWQKVSATVKAPAGATNARISMGTSKYFVTSGAYYDDVKLYSEEKVTALKFKKAQSIIDQFDLLDKDLYTDESYNEALVARNNVETLIGIAQSEQLLFSEGISEMEFNNRLLQVDIDNVTLELQKAIDELELYEAPVDPEKPVEPEKPVDPEEPTNPEKPVVPEKPTEKDPDTGIMNNSSSYLLVAVLAISVLLILKKRVKQ